MMTMDNGIEIKRWEDFGLIVVMDHVNPSQANFEYKTLHIPGMSGLLDYGTEIKEKNGITVPLNGLLKSEQETSRLLNDLNKFLFDEFKQPRYIKTIYDYEPAKYVWLKVASNFSLNRKTVVREFSIPFTQFDSNKYSVLEANDIVWGSQEVDFRADYTLGNSGTGARNLHVTFTKSFYPFIEGLALQPFFEISGSGRNIKITTAGNTINVGTLNNEKLEIDTENYVAYLNGKEVNFNLDEFYFIPGQKVVVTGTNMHLTFTVHYRDTFM